MKKKNAKPSVPKVEVVEGDLCRVPDFGNEAVAQQKHQNVSMSSQYVKKPKK